MRRGVLVLVGLLAVMDGFASVDVLRHVQPHAAMSGTRTVTATTGCPLTMGWVPERDAVANALVLGQASAMTADSPITEYAVHQQSGKIQIAGETFDVAPYGIAVEKGSALTGMVQKAVQRLIDDGTYVKILRKWGVQADAVTTAGVNLASAGPQPAGVTPVR